MDPVRPLPGTAFPRERALWDGVAGVAAGVPLTTAALPGASRFSAAAEAPKRARPPDD